MSPYSEISNYGSLPPKPADVRWQGYDTFGEDTFKTWIKTVAREQREKFWLLSEVFCIPVVFDTRLEACDSSNRLLCEASDVVYIIKM